MAPLRPSESLTDGAARGALTSVGASMSCAGVAGECFIKGPGGYPSGPARVKPGDGLLDSPTQFFPLLIFLYFGGLVVLFIVYSLVKKHQESNMHPAAKFRLEDNGTQLIGYRETPFGKLCFVAYRSVSLIITLLYILLIFDTYWGCQLRYAPGFEHLH